MKRVFAILMVGFLAMAAVPSVAGSIVITITNDAGATLGSRTYAVSTAHLLRLVAVMKARYGQVPSGPADPVTGIVPMRDRTNVEVVTAWLNGFIQGTIDAVWADEKAAASDTATATITPITAQ